MDLEHDAIVIICTIMISTLSYSETSETSETSEILKSSKPFFFILLHLYYYYFIIFIRVWISKVSLYCKSKSASKTANSTDPNITASNWMIIMKKQTLLL